MFLGHDLALQQDMTNTSYAMVVLSLVSELLAIVLIVRLWYRHHPRFLRGAIWTLILLVPIMGPISYGGLFDGPPSKHGLDPPIGEHTYDSSYVDF